MFGTSTEFKTLFRFGEHSSSVLVNNYKTEDASYQNSRQQIISPLAKSPPPKKNTHTHTTEHGIPHKNYETDKHNEAKLRFISGTLTRLAVSRDSPTYSSKRLSAIITVFCDCGAEVWSKAEHNEGVQSDANKALVKTR